MTAMDVPWQKGYVHVYTGNGKGKTTAAFGLVLRAVGAGLPVFIAQFMKATKTSEIKALKQFSSLVVVRQYGRKGFILNNPKEDDIQAARDGLEDVQKIFRLKRFKVIILDEANIACYFKLFSVDDLLTLIDSKPADVELVITGRNADSRLIDRADLVTEMREIKHYYTKGVKSRKGIER